MSYRWLLVCNLMHTSFSCSVCGKCWHVVFLSVGERYRDGAAAQPLLLWNLAVGLMHSSVGVCPAPVPKCNGSESNSGDDASWCADQLPGCTRLQLKASFWYPGYFLSAS
jgi:hypothetical protein